MTVEEITGLGAAQAGGDPNMAANHGNTNFASSTYYNTLNPLNPSALTYAGEVPYELKPHSSLLFDLRQVDFIHDARRAFGSSSEQNRHDEKLLNPDSVTLAVCE